ncbi:MAG: hypothetical protein ACJ75R_04375 [Solirubrobacterales bacterium]
MATSVVALVAITAGLLIGSAVISVLAESSFQLSAVFVWLITFVFSGIGALIAIRQPANKLGWIFLGVAVSAGLSELAHAYADYWTSGHGGLRSVAEAAAVYASLAWIPFILIPATFLLLLFPDGRLMSRRWRPIAWCAALGIAGAFVTSALAPGQLEDYPQLTNPYAVDSGVLDALTGLSVLALLIGVAGSAISLVVRYRRASGDLRLQIKWLALAGAIAAVTIPIGTAGYDLWGEDVSNVAIMLSVLGIPIAAGIAILRYRLYDVDVVINRTVVYGALTATLAAVYIASVLLLQLILNGATGDSSLAVAASTLGVAALFRPARSRIQEAVDRRFFRRRYDARLTLEQFASRVRDQVELAALDAELRGVVTETMHPAHVSLWLREGR